LLGFLHGISRNPRRLRRSATPGSQGEYQNAQDFHMT